MINHPLTKLGTHPLGKIKKIVQKIVQKMVQKMVQKIVQWSKGPMVQSIFYPMPEIMSILFINDWLLQVNNSITNSD